MTGLAGAPNYMNEASFSGRARSKRSRAPTTSWASTPVEPESLIGTTTGKPKSKRDSSPSKAASETGGLRRCSHCASEKTPQWRTGPLGPKTLCNACGVRYKSGRLVPEYRPAASPTFVLTQHSNSHRKVMELRRKKEEMRQQHQQRRQGEAEEQEQFYAHPQHHGFQVYWWRVNYVSHRWDVINMNGIGLDWLHYFHFCFILSKCDFPFCFLGHT